MKRRIIVAVILFQLALVAFISFRLVRKITKSRVDSAYLISSSQIHSFQSGGLKYFYEPKANAILEDKKDWLPYVARYTINQDSLNDRYDYPVVKPQNTYRIVTLGDSFTYGLSVSTPDNWTEILEDRLNKECRSAKYANFEVINLGVYGYDIPYAAERYRIRGKKYDPDMVVWLLFDPLRVREFMSPILKKCNPSADNGKKSTFSQYFDCWVYAEEQIENQLGKQGIADLLQNSFRSIFRYFNRKLVVLDFFNNHGSILKGAGNIHLLSRFKITPYFTEGEDHEKYYLYDGHPNKAGHAAIAADVFSYLKQNGLIPCK